MDRQRLVVAVHLFVAAGLVAFGAYRVSRGSVVPGALNVLTAVAVAVVGVYVGRLA
jgi:hypothetical protein